MKLSKSDIRMAMRLRLGTFPANRRTVASEAIGGFIRDSQPWQNAAAVLLYVPLKDEPDVWPRLRQQFKLEVFEGAAWRTITQGKTSGHGAKEPLKPMTAQKFRLTMDCDKGSPGVAEFQLYRAE